MFVNKKEKKPVICINVINYPSSWHWLCAYTIYSLINAPPLINAHSLFASKLLLKWQNITANEHKYYKLTSLPLKILIISLIARLIKNHYLCLLYSIFASESLKFVFSGNLYLINLAKNFTSNKCHPPFSKNVSALWGVYYRIYRVFVIASLPKKGTGPKITRENDTTLLPLQIILHKKHLENFLEISGMPKLNNPSLLTVQISHISENWTVFTVTCATWFAAYSCFWKQNNLIW